MLEHLVEADSFGDVDSEAASDKVFGISADRNMLREGKCACSDLFVSLLHIRRLKRWSSNQHGVADDSNSPHVYVVGVASVGFENFGCEIVWSSTNCSLLLTCVENLCSKTKISNLQAHAVSQEKISQFEVSVNNFPRMDILDSIDQLENVVASFDLMKAFATLDQVRKRLV